MTPGDIYCKRGADCFCGEPSVKCPSSAVAHANKSGDISSSILTEAAGIVAGSRNETHGEKERSFIAIAAVWTAYLTARREPDGPIRPSDVAHMMVLLKQQRAEWGLPARDHFVDGAGYSAIAGELMLGDKH